MNKNLNWKLKKFFNQKRPFVLLATLCFITLLFIQSTSKQSNDVICRTKSIQVGNEIKAFTAFQKVGSSFPCGEEMAIAIEDFGRYMFSAQSGHLATVVPGTDQHTLPPDGPGNNKTSNLKEMTYQGAYNRIKDLLIGTFEGVYGQRWAIPAEQAKELFKQVHTVNLAGVEHFAIDQNNMFYDGLIATQLLIEKTEEQAVLIEKLSTENKLLFERLKAIEQKLDKAAVNKNGEMHNKKHQNKTNLNPLKSIPNFIGEVKINPNVGKAGDMEITYNLNASSSKAKLIFTDIEGRSIQQISLNKTSGKQKLNINLNRGTYLYYLKNNQQQSITQKLIIQ